MRLKRQGVRNKQLRGRDLRHNHKDQFQLSTATFSTLQALPESRTLYLIGNERNQKLPSFSWFSFTIYCPCMTQAIVPCTSTTRLPDYRFRDSVLYGTTSQPVLQDLGLQPAATSIQFSVLEYSHSKLCIGRLREKKKIFKGLSIFKQQKLECGVFETRRNPLWKGFWQFM